MTQQRCDSLMIDGQHHLLAKTADILPLGHADAIGLEIKRESTANYKGWGAHWKIEDGRIWLAELWVFGLLKSKKPKSFEECANEQEFRAALIAHSTPRRIYFNEIFGTEPPLFASWVSKKLIAISTCDDTQYRRDDTDGVTGAFTRFIEVENGFVISDETIPNLQWNPERSEHRRQKDERERAIRAAEEFDRRRGALAEGSD